MNINKINAKTKDFYNVVIEIASGSNPIKYEFDKEAGAIIVDRFLSVAMHYPCNYGFIPNSLSDDGDPTDVLVITPFPLIPASVITVKPIGVLLMEDEAGQDEKILAIPTDKICKEYQNINSYTDLPQVTLDKIEHFFTKYKDLDSNKWVKVAGWEDSKVANQKIEEAIQRFNADNSQ